MPWCSRRCTDYVPEHIRARVTQAAADVPPRQRARFKEPFARTSPIELCTLRQGRILRKAKADLLAVRQSLLINPDNEQAQRKEHAIETAIERIKEMEVNAHVPNHWAAMVPDLLVMNQEDDE